MTTNNIGITDPFSDHAVINEETRRFMAHNTLNVGRNATLTLGADALIVLDEGPRDHPRFKCCGLVPTRSRHTKSVPYYNILSAEYTKTEIIIKYAKPISKTSVCVAHINYSLDTSISIPSVTTWIETLLRRSYGRAKQNKRIKLLLNPYGGAGKAVKLYTREAEPIFAAAKCELDVERTRYSGHAVEIAQNLDIDAYDVVAAASGDGVPFEIFNGLGKKPNAAEALRKIAVVQLPCGTGNAMSWNLNGTGDCSMAALSIVKGIRTPIDLVSITQGDQRTLSFLSQSIGIVAESDLGTDNIRWMGDARFTYGFLVRVLGKTLYPCDIAVKAEITNKKDIKKHFAEHMAKRRCGNIVSHSDLDSSVDLSKGLGLPPLKYGTINDPLPQGNGWTPLIPYPNLGNLYCGNMAYMLEDAPFFPAALPSDGLLDCATINGDISAVKAVNVMLSVTKPSFFDTDYINFKKISAIRVVPRFGRWAEKDEMVQRQSRLGRILQKIGVPGNGGNGSIDGGYFSVDGEKMPFEPFQIEVHKGLGTVLACHEGAYEYAGPHGWRDFEIREPGRTDSDYSKVTI